MLPMERQSLPMVRLAPQYQAHHSGNVASSRICQVTCILGSVYCTYLQGKHVLSAWIKLVQAFMRRNPVAELSASVASQL